MYIYICVYTYVCMYACVCVCTGTKVVVVTPKITVSLPDGSTHDDGKMNLPKHVLQVCCSVLQGVAGCCDA